MSKKSSADAPIPVREETSPPTQTVEAGNSADEQAIDAPAPVRSEPGFDPAQFGLIVDGDGLISLTMHTALSGPEINLSPGDPHRASVQEACRLAQAGFAGQGTPQA